MKKKLLTFGITSCAILLLGIQYKQQQNDKQQLISSLNDSLSYYKDKYNVLHSKTNSNKTCISQTELNSKNAKIQELQKLLEKYKSPQPTRKTEIKEIIKTDTIVVNDTSLPVYRSDFMLYGGTNKLQVYGSIKMQKDSTALELHTIDRFNVVTHKEKNNLILYISNENPYSVIEYQKKVVKLPKQKKFGLGVNAGYGLSKNGLSPYIGLGVNYNIIEF